MVTNFKVQLTFNQNDIIVNNHVTELHEKQTKSFLKPILDTDCYK